MRFLLVFVVSFFGLFALMNWSMGGALMDPKLLPVGAIVSTIFAGYLAMVSCVKAEDRKEQDAFRKRLKDFIDAGR